MTYLTETHAHTSEVSVCSQIMADELAECYIAAGYTTLVVTDHFNAATFAAHEFASYQDQISYYLSGYKRVVERAAGRLHVLLGMELTLCENNNDYLVYGVTEAFLRQHEGLRQLHIDAFSRLAHENGLLLFQAHPFRNGMTVVRPNLLDGVETYNASQAHDSRNEIALSWAERFGLLQSSGSDCHSTDGVGMGGLVTERPITDSDALIDALKGGAPLHRVLPDQRQACRG